MLSQADIDARLARYAVSCHASDLWPEVSPEAFRDAQREIGRVTARVLADEPGPIAMRCPEGAEPRAVGVAAFASGMGPLLGFWSETGRIQPEPEITALLAMHLDHGRRRALKLRGELASLVSALGRRGVEVTVLKGSHTAYAYFPEPGTRPTADLDLAVRPVDGGTAVHVLRDLGFVQDPASVVAERSHWHPPSPTGVKSLELGHADNPWHVDLHVTLDRTLGPGTTMSLGLAAFPLWHGWGLHELTAAVLPQPLLLAYLASHASSHLLTLPLVSLVELVLVSRADFRGSPKGWRELDDLVRRTRSGRFLYSALDLAERLAPGAVDGEVLSRCREAAPWHLRRVVRGARPATMQRLHPIPRGGRYLWAGSPRELLALLVDTVWPRDHGRLVSPARAIHDHLGRGRWLIATLFGRTRRN